MKNTPTTVYHGTADEAIEWAISRGTFSNETAIISFICDWYERILTQETSADFLAWVANNSGKRISQDLFNHLSKLEWSGFKRGQGTGYMGSGGNGFRYPSCPSCGGLKEPNNEFEKSAVGHRIKCTFADQMEQVKADLGID